MDTRTGEILPKEIIDVLSKAMKSHFIQMQVLPTPNQLKRHPPRVGRNEACPCGSGRKFKHCHLSKEPAR